MAGGNGFFNRFKWCGFAVWKLVIGFGSIDDFRFGRWAWTFKCVRLVWSGGTGRG